MTPHNLDIILTLTAGLSVAVLFGLVTQRLRLSPIVGYLLAGIAVGPFTPGLVAHSEITAELAEIGIILLMFGVGLHFHVKDLLAVRKIAIPGAIAQIAVATGLAVLVTRGAGFGLGSAVVFGIAVSVASTVVMLRLLVDQNALHTPAGHVAVGWLLVEDIFTVLVLVVLPTLRGGQASEGWTAILLSAGLAVLKIAGLVAVILVVGQRVIPLLLGYVARTRSRELFTLTVLSLALGIAVGSAVLFGASMALGAFLAGLVVGQSEFSARAASEALPMRDAFAVLFFVSVGMLFDPRALLSNLGLTAATLAVILLAKPLTALLVSLLLGYPARVAVTVGIALAQIGEFSFILAALGRQLGVLPERATPVLVAASIVSITLNPLLFRLVDPTTRWLSAWLSARMARKPAADASSLPTLTEGALHAIVVGHGPVGRTLLRLLLENNLAATVIDLNHETVNQLLRSGVRALHGDASQQEILEQAGVRSATSLIFSASSAPEAVVRLAKELNPDLLILARATYLSEMQAVKQAGADDVVSAEGEVALGMAERLLTELGATAEQIDRARARRHALILEREMPASTSAER